MVIFYPINEAAMMTKMYYTSTIMCRDKTLRLSEPSQLLNTYVPSTLIFGYADGCFFSFSLEILPADGSLFRFVKCHSTSVQIQRKEFPPNETKYKV